MNGVDTELHPRVSLNSISTASWPLERDIDLWRELALGRVGLPLRKLRPDVDASLELARVAGVEVALVAMSGAFRLGEPETHASSQQRLVAELDALVRAGVPTAYVVTGPSRRGMTTDESIDEFCTAIIPVVEHARNVGVDLGLEASSTMTHDSGCVHSLTDALAVGAETGLSVVVELQNCWYERGLRTTFARHVDQFSVVQVSDFVVGTDVRLSRAVPGDGDIPLERLIGDLLDAGYRGLFDLEVLGPRIEDEGYRSAVARGLRWTSECLDRLGVPR